MVAETEIAIVGAGIVGLSTAFTLIEQGAPVTVYERGVPGASQSGGESRIFRHSHDDPRLVRWAYTAREQWRDWEERFGCELLSRDGVVEVGAGVQRHLAILEQMGGVTADRIGESELTQRLPVLAPWSGPAMFDQDGGVIRVRAAVHHLSTALHDRLVFEEVLSVRVTPRGTVELRSGGKALEYRCVVVCAGRGTAALARGAGLALPVRQSAHVRLTYPVRGSAPARLACLLDGREQFGEVGAYGDPLPGNGTYAVGLDETPVDIDGSLHDAQALTDAAHRTTAFVKKALPGLEPYPVDVRHCWVTELPWGIDAIAGWEADGLLVLAGNNMFKHAPALGQALARAALGQGLPSDLRAEAQLGARTSS